MQLFCHTVLLVCWHLKEGTHFIRFLFISNSDLCCVVERGLVVVVLVPHRSPQLQQRVRNLRSGFKKSFWQKITVVG